MATQLANGDSAPYVGQVWRIDPGDGESLDETVTQVSRDTGLDVITWATTDHGVTYQVHRVSGSPPQATRVLANPDPRLVVWPPSDATLVYDPEAVEARGTANEATLQQHEQRLAVIEQTLGIG